jgi:hypothetical protein
MDRGIEVAAEDHRSSKRIHQPGESLDLPPTLGRADVGQVGRDRVNRAAPRCNIADQRAASFPHARLDVAISEARQLVAAPARLDDIVIGRNRQRDGPRRAYGQAAQQRVAPRVCPDGGVGFRFDDGQVVDTAVATVEPQQAADVTGHVSHDSVDRHQRDFLERDDIGIEGGDDLADAIQASAVDLAPPGRWEWTGPDRGPDIERDDRQSVARGWLVARYFTDPASRPWTK